MASSNHQTEMQTPNGREIVTQELLAKRDDLGMGVLIGNITYDAIKVAINNGETPYAVFSPRNSDKLYLLSILQMNSTKQMLRPATIQDLESSGEGKTEVIKYYTTKKESAQLKTPAKDGPSNCHLKILMPKLESDVKSKEAGAADVDIKPDSVSTLKFDDQASSQAVNNVPKLENSACPIGKIVERTRRVFSHVAVVAVLKQIFDPEAGLCTLKLEPSAPYTIEKVELCKPDTFVRHGIQCPVKRLRCYSESNDFILSCPPAPWHKKSKHSHFFPRSFNGRIQELRNSTSEEADDGSTSYDVCRCCKRLFN